MLTGKTLFGGVSEGLDEDEKGTGKIGTLGGTQPLSSINESGVYALNYSLRNMGCPF